MTGPRDWDKEMAEIDRLLAAGPPAGGAAAPGTPAAPAKASRGGEARPRSAAAPAAMAATRGRHVAAVWGRAVLGTAVAVALPFWPYPKSCGTMLYLYLFATFTVIVAGIWTMRYAWTHRRGVAHVAGLLVLLAGLGLAALEIVQRTSLVALPLHWTCP